VTQRTSSAASPTSSASAPTQTGLTATQQEWLTAHVCASSPFVSTIASNPFFATPPQNAVRAQHGAAALTYSTDLEATASAWAKQCKWQHSGGKFGENLFAGSGSSWTPTSAVSNWAAEVAQYDPANPQYSHFTQVVWKATTQVGCVIVTCGKELVAAWSSAQYMVCEYNPAGNVIGQFAQNVQA
jgi:uncharacterized protein YkwD